MKKGASRATGTTKTGDGTFNLGFDYFATIDVGLGIFVAVPRAARWFWVFLIGLVIWFACVSRHLFFLAVRGMIFLTCHEWRLWGPVLAYWWSFLVCHYTCTNLRRMAVAVFEKTARFLLYLKWLWTVARCQLRWAVVTLIFRIRS